MVDHLRLRAAARRRAVSARRACAPRSVPNADRGVIYEFAMYTEKAPAEVAQVQAEATSTETKGRENRHHAVTVRSAREIHSLSQTCGNFEQGQGSKTKL
jgi:hypothetical protein